ncbi:MAG: FGGY-family carbohydrate kinase [Promethearchaeota archaeon]
MSELICVFDVGTTGARTIIINGSGKVISKSYEEYPIVEQPTGISEQDPQIWWNAIKNTCNRAVKTINVNDIIGISSTFLRGTITIVDKEGKVLYPALTWMDEREEHTAKEWTKEDDLRRIIPKILWIQKNRPALFEKTAKIIYPDTYIYMKLCDVYVTDPTNGVLGILNRNTLEWDEKLSELYNLPLGLWPELHASGDVIGELNKNSANDLGLKKNTPIIVGGGDQQCSSLGLGVINKGQFKITVGTGTFVDGISDKPIQPAGDFPIFSYPSVIKGNWNVEGLIPGTGTAFKWFKDNFSQLQIKESLQKNIDVYDVLTQEASHISAGSEGLLFIPLYMFKKGTIHGIGWNHTRAHMIRAIMESAALAAQVYLTIVEGMLGTKANEVKVDGGAMNSPLWTQIFADVLSRKVLVPEVKDGAAMGAAILGFLGCKRYNRVENAIQEMIRFSEIKEPDKTNIKVYKKLNRIFMPTLLDIYSKKRVTKDL